jgi:hypothetical protein
MSRVDGPPKRVFTATTCGSCGGRWKRACAASDAPTSTVNVNAVPSRRYLKRPLRISWASFQSNFGAGYAETPQGRSRFRGNAIEALRRVKVVYPQLKIEIQRDGILLYPSLTHVPKAHLLQS